MNDLSTAAKEMAKRSQDKRRLRSAAVARVVEAYRALCTDRRSEDIALLHRLADELEGRALHPAG